MVQASLLFPQAHVRRIRRFDPVPGDSEFADQGLLVDGAEDGELAAPAPDGLVLVDEGELGVVEGADGVGVDVVDGLALVPSDEAGAFVFSVSGAAGLSDVSLPPGFILSE
ncbi:MAG: hypothetical protein LZF62_340093 [Nitrospira sp.]|nr:MAG: hypothetical protein LZF62_340093 [Nitrospira sp.]